MQPKAYAVMDYVEGKTLNELAYMKPDVIEADCINIAFQLGMHTAFSYVFGVKDGYQTNYIYDPRTKVLTRIDKEKFLSVPHRPEKTLEDGDLYTQEIASCELTNLKYIPAFRKKDTRPIILKAFNTGFYEKYGGIKGKKSRLLNLIFETRRDTLKVQPDVNETSYENETTRLVRVVEHLIEQNPKDVLLRLYKAKGEYDEKTG